MRLGLNTSLVVVGRIGDNLRMDYIASGDSTNLAARLQQMAPAESVFVGEATYRLAEKLNGLKKYLPCFEDLLSLPTNDPNYIQLSTQMRRDRTFEALIKLFQKIAEDKQLILTIEDLHWVDQISKEFISAFLDAIGKHQIFLILLSRPECLCYDSSIPQGSTGCIRVD
jgi:hypothetical protein